MFILESHGHLWGECGAWVKEWVKAKFFDTTEEARATARAVCGDDIPYQIFTVTDA